MNFRAYLVALAPQNWRDRNLRGPPCGASGVQEILGGGGIEVQEILGGKGLETSRSTFRSEVPHPCRPREKLTLCTRLV